MTLRMRLVMDDWSVLCGSYLSPIVQHYGGYLTRCTRPNPPIPIVSTMFISQSFNKCRFLWELSLLT